MQELLRGHVTRRKLDASALDFGTPERAGGDMIRQTVTVKQGIDRELARTIITALKDGKLKVQASHQGDDMWTSGKNSRSGGTRGGEGGVRTGGCGVETDNRRK